MLANAVRSQFTKPVHLAPPGGSLAMRSTSFAPQLYWPCNQRGRALEFTSARWSVENHSCGAESPIIAIGSYPIQKRAIVGAESDLSLGYRDDRVRHEDRPRLPHLRFHQRKGVGVLMRASRYAARRGRASWLSLVCVSACAGCSCGDDGGAPPTLDAQRPNADVLIEEGADETSLDGAPLSECEIADINHSVAGCDYWVFSPHRLNEFACGAVILSNLSSSDATIQLSFRGKALNVTKSMVLVKGSGKSMTYEPLTTPSIPPGRSAVLSLFQGKVEIPGEECPSPAAGSNVMVPAGQDPLSANVGDAFRVQSSVPIAGVFEHPYAFPGSNVTGATALRSVSSWGTRYRDVGDFQAGRPDQQLGFPIEKATTMLVTQSASTISLHSFNGLVGVSLQAGRVLTAEQDDTFIGTPMTSSVPFGAWTSAEGFTPYNWASMEITYLQFAPVDDWGSEYAAVRHPPRFQPEEDAIWRMVADADGTMLSYDPAPPPGAPTSLKAGEQAVFFAGSPFVVRSQDAGHRFHLSQTMTGFFYASVNRGDASVQDAAANAPFGFGDPELESTPPPSEYTNHYAFLTDATFPTTYLVFIRKSDDGGFHDVVLDCAGPLGGWTAIGASAYQYVYVPLSRGAFQPQIYSGGLCDNGPHVADSKGPFSIAVWSWGDILNDYTALGVSFGYLVPGRSVRVPTTSDAGPN